MTEIWRPIPGFEGLYEVSDHGRVRSLDRIIIRAGVPARYRGRILKTARHTHDYRSVVLSDHGTQRSFLVHDLVASTFIGPRPVGAQVCHNDGQRDGNRLSNLRYDTPRGNHADKLAHGTLRHSEAHHNARLSRADVARIRQRYRSESKASLAADYGVAENHIYRIAARKRWAHV